MDRLAFSLAFNSIRQSFNHCLYHYHRRFHAIRLLFLRLLYDRHHCHRRHPFHRHILLFLLHRRRSFLLSIKRDERKGRPFVASFMRKIRLPLLWRHLSPNSDFRLLSAKVRDEARQSMRHQLASIYGYDVTKLYPRLRAPSRQFCQWGLFLSSSLFAVSLSLYPRTRPSQLSTSRRFHKQTHKTAGSFQCCLLAQTPVMHISCIIPSH